MKPVFYSFRRCPYAMRARLALVSAQVPVALREVVLKDKPQEFLEASPSGTVPCLVTDQGAIDESLDIMVWALKQNDPDRLLDMPDAGWQLIETCDGAFKSALDRTKYATRYPGSDPKVARAQAAEFLHALEAQLSGSLFGKATLADPAILPFVRQFAFIDRPWFDAQDWPRLKDWLAQFLTSGTFCAIMPKYPQWHAGEAGIAFP